MHMNKINKFYLCAKYMNWLFLIGSILLLVFTIYRTEFVLHGEYTKKYLDYYIVSIGGILFWGLTLKLNNKIRTNIIVSIFSLLVALYLVEGVLNIFEIGKKSVELKDRLQVAKEIGIEFDQRSRLEVINDLAIKGLDAVPTFLPAHLPEQGLTNETKDKFLFPLAGVSKIITVESNESGQFCVYQSDRHGFNNPDDQWDSSQVEYLLVGDSFTHGFAVQPGEDIPSQIRSITNSSVINLGIPGNGPLIELGGLKEYAEFLTPNKVLWLYYEENDLGRDLQKEQKSVLLTSYLDDGFSQNLINRQQEIDNNIKLYIKKEQGEAQKQAQIQAGLYKTRWMRLYEVRKLLNFGVNSEIIISVDQMFSDILEKAKNRTEAWGGEFYFVYLPEFSRYVGEIDHNRYRKKSEVIDLVKRLNIPVIDIHQEVFLNNPDLLSLFPLRLSGHYNKDGYRLVAKAIINSID